MMERLIVINPNTRVCFVNKSKLIVSGLMSMYIKGIIPY